MNMIEKYTAAKSANPDSIILCRIGDFYEIFGDDAIQLAPLLQLTLTSRQGMPMIGFPYHLLYSMECKLISIGKAGYIHLTND